MQQSPRLKLLSQFRDQMIRFLDELIEQLPSESQFIIIRIFFKDKIPVEDIMGNFIKQVLPHKHYIKTRNEKFFLQGTNIYNAAYKSHGKQSVDHFKNLWKSNLLDTEDRKVLWSWFDLFVLLGEKYLKTYGYVKGWEPDNKNLEEKKNT